MALLLQVKSYVQDRGSTSLMDIANKFETSPDALRGMLEHWVRKGVIVRQDFADGCGGCKPSPSCGACGTSATFEFYSWKG